MLNRLRCALLLLLSVFAAVNAFCVNNASSSEFRDPTPEERAMTSVSFAPGAPAVALNWRQFINDRDYYRSEYVRIKILSEEGKKYGDIEIPHIGLISSVDHIKARTVRPDGTIAAFDGKTFDKVIVKVNGVRLIAKTFTLPDVQVGSIIEYRYDLENRTHITYDSAFMVQREIPVVHEELSLQPSLLPGYKTFFSFRGLPPGKQPELHAGIYDLELENIPPFEEEPFSPPVTQLKPELQFWYTSGTTEPAEFWNKQAREWAEAIEPFVVDSRDVRDAAAAAAAGSKTPEETMRKLYARVQQIRNLSFEPDKTDQETRKFHDNRSAQDVLRNGYGDLWDINRLFVALARAAGIDAHVVRICERDEQFLAKQVPVGNQLDGEVAVVIIAGKSLYLDPGTPYAPFGTLSWQKSSTSGLLIARKQDVAVWVDTPQQNADAATTKREVDLQLDNGVVRGTAVITYRGQEALRQRLDLRNDDDAAARKSLEESMKTWFSVGAIVKVTEVKDLRSTEAPLVISGTLELPSAASLVGSRTMIPLSIFAATQTNPFASEQRKAAIYFHYAYDVEDDVTLKVPPGYDIESVPVPTNINMGALRYLTTFQKSDGTVRLRRNLSVDAQVIGRDQYAHVRTFFSNAAAADQEQVIFRRATSPAGSAK
jgi:hypothetical protein